MFSNSLCSTVRTAKVLPASGKSNHTESSTKYCTHAYAFLFFEFGRNSILIKLEMSCKLGSITVSGEVNKWGSVYKALVIIWGMNGLCYNILESLAFTAPKQARRWAKAHYHSFPSCHWVKLHKWNCSSSMAVTKTCDIVPADVTTCCLYGRDQWSLSFRHMSNWQWETLCCRRTVLPYAGDNEPRFQYNIDINSI